MSRLANLFKIFSIYILISLMGCSGGSTEKQTDEKISIVSSSPAVFASNQTPFAYVERNITERNAWITALFNSKLNETENTPTETVMPYEFNLGAKLIVRSGLDTNATEEEILLTYFGSEEYDVKDLNISPDGTLLLFSARGSVVHSTDNTWNIFTYRFADQQLNRIITNDTVANAGEDTNPVLTLDGKIIFSSDRDEGNPLNPRDSDEVNEFCDYEDPVENPSLLHSMNVAGQNITQLTYGTVNHDINPTNLNDGRIAFVRWERSFQTLNSCSDGGTPSTNVFPSGVLLPPVWNDATECAYSEFTTTGAVIETNHYKLLTISSDGESMEQLYETSSTASSDEAFLVIDQILQAENGNLFSLIRHRYSQTFGGALVELQPSQNAQSGIVLSELSPLSLTATEIDLYPEQQSQGGWFSAFWPYRDGTSRLLVSWSQCALIKDGVSRFCGDGAIGELDVNYGIWVFDPNTQARSPIVRAKNDTVFTELAMAQPHATSDLNLTPFEPNFVDNPDGTVVVCHYPNEMPIAVAGADQNGYAGISFNFDGSASSDPDEDPLTYQWSLTSAPAQSAAILINPTSIRPSLETDIAGQYIIELLVNDGELDSVPDSLIITTTQNNKPVADASNDQTVVVNNLVTLDGSNSSDVDGHSLTYQWSIISQPSNSVLTNPTSLNPTFMPTQVGNYVAQLIVNDGFVDSDADTVTIVVQAPNLIPIANAGLDHTTETGVTITLDGSNSSDPENATLAYQWSVTSAPVGASFTLINSNQFNPGFVTNTEGSYVISLIVNDGLLDSSPDSVTITVNRSNAQPVANAGADQLGEVGQQLILNGSASSDPDGDSLSYQWNLLSVPAGSTTSLLNPTSISPILNLDVTGEYIVQLVVNDGVLNSLPDNVILTAEKVNTAPVANAGSDQQSVGTTLLLDGSASSDIDGDTLSYLWTIVSPADTSVTLSDPTAVSPTILPEANQDYVIELVVFDGELYSLPDQMSINYLNTKPIADAGVDQSASVGDNVQLDGSASRDANGDTLTYQWRIVSTPPTAGSQAILSNVTAVNPTLVVDVEGYFTLELIVNDGTIDSEPDVMLINTMDENTTPVANAGPDQSFQINQTLMLDGSASSDTDGDQLTYHWSIISPADSTEVISDANVVAPSISPSGEQTLVIQLIVNDGNQDSEPDTVELSFDNTKPLANAGEDQRANVGDLLTLDGSNSSDADGHPLTYQWSIVSAPSTSTATLSDPRAVMPTLIMDQEGLFVVQLIVNDGQEDSQADSVTLNSVSNTKPVANAGIDQTLNVGDQAVLDGQQSFDSDGDTLSYRWSLLSQPENSTASLVNQDQVSPSLDIDVAGEYVVQLIVNDGQVDSEPDAMMISTQNLRPIAEAGLEQTVESGSLVVLDGSASSDPDGDTLTHRWSLLSQPQDSSAALNNSTIIAPEFVADKEGLYVVQLIVNDGLLDSLADTVTIEVNDIPPSCELYPITLPAEMLANATNGELFSHVPLGNGNGNYGWLSWNGSNSANTLARSLIAPGNSQNYRNYLDETDRSLDLFDWVSGAPGVKNSRAVREGLDQLIGRDIVIPVWSETQGQGSQFGYMVEGFAKLEITDYRLGGNGWLSLEFKEHTSCENQAPNANAGEPINVQTETQVMLDGSASNDPENDPLSYQWTLVQKPESSSASLFDPEMVNPEFFADVSGSYVVQLIVNDGELSSTPDTVNVEVTDEAPVCEISDATERTLPVTIRDFTPAHPDFEAYIGLEYGIVKKQLGNDGLPQYRGGNGSVSGSNIGAHMTTGAEHFYQWYRDTPGINITIPKTLTLTREPDSTIWKFSDHDFFPINGEGFGNYQSGKNFHFTMETHLIFDYKGGETFTFRGDDDLWLFINGKLAIDIGGVHSAEQRTINLDTMASELGIEPNNSYSFDLFFAERHVVQSVFTMQTNMDLQCVFPE